MSDKVDSDTIWHKEGIPLEDDPQALLALPEGLLALEGLPVMFHGAASYPVTQDKVLAAAEHILQNRSDAQVEKRFHTQAQVIAFASQEFGWHTGKDMRFAATYNFMEQQPEDEATKQAKAEIIDATIEMLNSGLLTTREGTRKLFPHLDVDAIWDKHEAEKKAAVERQKEQMAKHLKAIEQERAERDEPPVNESKDSRWRDSVRESRNKPNPCLGF